jgi:hypothetical protein
VSAAHGEEALRSGYRQAPTNKKPLRTLRLQIGPRDFPGPRGVERQAPARARHVSGTRAPSVRWGALSNLQPNGRQPATTCALATRHSRPTPPPHHRTTHQLRPDDHQDPAAFRARSRIDTLLIPAKRVRGSRSGSHPRTGRESSSRARTPGRSTRDDRFPRLTQPCSFSDLGPASGPCLSRGDA